MKAEHTNRAINKGDYMNTKRIHFQMREKGTKGAMGLQRKVFAFVSCAAFMISATLFSAGCTLRKTDDQNEYVTRVASLKGPTSVGLLNMMKKSENNEFPEKYDFSIEANSDVIVQKMLQDEIDVALIPANVAALLYNKTDGGVRVLDVCANSVLDVVARSGLINTFSDLAGKTVYTMGKGTSPEYVLTYLLQEADIAPLVNVQYKQEATEVMQALSEDPTAVAVLPQPFATVASSKIPDCSVVLDLGSVWETYAPPASRLVCGVTVLRTKYLEEHEKLAEEFVRHQDDSVKKAQNQIGETAKLMVSYGILDNEEIAKKAIPYCGLTCTRNEEMRKAVGGYLAVLEQQDAVSIGGALPGDHFYISETF